MSASDPSRNSGNGNNGNKRDEPPLRSPESGNKKFENMCGYAKTNPRDVAGYALLILGIILLFVQPIYGGLLVGVALGIYFSKEIIQYTKDIERFVEEQGLVRSVVLGGTLLAFFISAPAIFVGCALVIAIKLLISAD
jgi:hypothetical protein